MSHGPLVSNTVTYGPSALKIIQRVSDVSGCPGIFLSGTTSGTLSSLGYQVHLSSAGTPITSVIPFASWSVTGHNWSGWTSSIPIGPSGSAWPDWYDIDVTFGHLDEEQEEEHYGQPFAVGINVGLVGQSNMAYWGSVEGGSLGGYGEPFPHASGVSVLSALASTDAMNWAAPDGSGLKYFLSSLSQYYQMPIGAIQLAAGGAPLFKEYDHFYSYIFSRTKKGCWLDKTSDLWYDTVRCIRECSGFELMVTHQGEAETFWTGTTGTWSFSIPEYRVTPDIYKAGFEVLIQRIRDLVGRPKLPVVLGQLPGILTDIASWITYGTDYDNIARGQVRIAEADTNVYLVPTYDLDRNDVFHFNSQGYADFAIRAAHVAKYAKGNATGYRGPVLQNIVRKSDTVYDLKFRHSNEATGWSTNTSSINLSGFHVLDQGGASYKDIVVTVKDDTTLQLTVPSLSHPAKIGFNTFGLVQFPTNPPSANLAAYPFDNADLSMPLYSWDGYRPLPKETNNVPQSLRNLNSNALETITQVILNKHDEGSTLLNDAIDLYLSSNTFYTNVESAGPFYKFLKALSWSMYDINTLIEQIGELVDIEQCPKEFYAYLAKLIGWKLISNDLDAWRAQLRQAIYLYKAKGTRTAFESALKLIFPDKSFDPTDRITELWETTLPKLIYYTIKTESPHIDTWSSEDSRDFDIPYSKTNPDYNARFLVDFILARIEEDLPGYLSDHIGFRFGDDLYDYRGSDQNVVPPWETERFYNSLLQIPETKPIIAFHLSGPKSQKGLDVPVSAVNAIFDYMENARYSELLQGTNNRWKFYTSSINIPFNYNSVIGEYTSKNVHLMDYWSGKSSTIALELSAGDFDFSINELQSNSGYALDALVEILKDFKPFHVLMEIILYQDFSDPYAAQDVILSWDVRFCFNDKTTDGALGGFENVAFAMVSGTGDLPRGPNNRMPLTTEANSAFYTVSANLPRKSIRRRDREFGLSYCSFYKRDGRSMPVGWDFLGISSQVNNQTAPISSTGFLPRGFNPSTGDYFPSGSIIYSPDLVSSLTISGIPVSAFYPCRDLTGLPDVDITHYETRANLETVMEIFFNALQRKATKEFLDTFLSSNPDYTGPLPQGNPWDDGQTFEQKFHDFILGRPLNKIYNDHYRAIFQRHLFDSYTDFYVKGGGHFYSHLVGPLVFNSDMYVAGSALMDLSSDQRAYLITTSAGDYTQVTARNGNTYDLTDSLMRPDISIGSDRVGAELADYLIDIGAGGGKKLETISMLSGVILGMGFDSVSVIVLNSSEGDDYSVDAYTSGRRSVSLLNRDTRIDAAPYIQFNLGSSIPDASFQGWTLNGDVTNNFLPDQKYTADFYLRDSDRFENSEVGIALFVDDFFGQTYWFDWNKKVWKHKDSLIRIKRKDQNNLFDLDPIYKRIQIKTGDKISVDREELLWDPKENTKLTSDYLRKITLEFNTYNLNIDEVFKRQGFAHSHGGLHQVTTKYYLRIMNMTNNGAFLTLRDINIRNKTYEEKANDYYLSAGEVADIYEHFDSLADDFFSRDKTVTSGTHGDQGGSRLTYIEPAGYGSLSSTPVSYGSAGGFTGSTALSSSIYEISDG